MARGVSDFDKVLAWVGVTASSIGKSAGGVLFNLRSFGSSLADTDAEVETGAEQYGVAGFLFRPRDEDNTGGVEGIAARATDDLAVLATRDLRITAARGQIDKGTFTVASYTGAHMTILDRVEGTTKGSIALHQPTQANSNAPHDVVLDGAIGAERITITHALGQKVVLDENGKVTIYSRTGAVQLQLDDAGGIVATNGGSALAVALALPLLTFDAQVVTAFAQVKAALGGAGAGVTVPTLPTNAASTVLKAS